MAQTSPASPSASDKLDREIIVIASVVIVGAIMSILDTTIVNVALATLVASYTRRCRRSNGSRPDTWSRWRL